VISRHSRLAKFDDAIAGFQSRFDSGPQAFHGRKRGPESRALVRQFPNRTHMSRALETEMFARYKKSSSLLMTISSCWLAYSQMAAVPGSTSITG
jgi:hypothetical protein